MATVFLSFSNQDRSFAQPLRHALTSLGYSVWSFDEQIVPGDRWQDAILDRLKDVDAVAVIFSKSSASSGWIHHELGAAVAYARERGRPLIIPIVLGDVQLPANLAQFQGIFARNDSPEEVALKIAEGLDRISGIEFAREEKRKEVSKHVESSASDFIQESLDELSRREKVYQGWAYVWYGLAYSTLLATVAFGIWRVLVKPPTTTDWPALVELALTGVVVVGLLISLAKYAFSLGKSFMVEALRNADRRHAISFGKFYLRAHGSAVDWAEVKEVFQHWNIDKGSQFIGQQAADLDPQLFAMAIEIAKAILAQSRGK